MYIGKYTPSAIKNSFACSSMPNHSITRGMSARCGIVRTICTEVSRNRSASGDRPVSRPVAMPNVPPIKNPASARAVEMPMCFGN